MTVVIAPAEAADLPQMIALLLEDAEARRAVDPDLWPLAADASARIEADLPRALADAGQVWRVGRMDGRIVGLAHGMMLPVPPIYAAGLGRPGLVMDEAPVARDAPEGVEDSLMEAVEQALRERGAEMLLASVVPGVPGRRAAPERRGYAPLTLYMAGPCTPDGGSVDGVRSASENDLPGIVEVSAAHRATLQRLHAFWEPHAEADARFGAWMARSLQLGDRDMFVAAPEGEVRGYVIAQPAPPLHWPAAHDRDAIGFVDDFHDRDLDAIEAAPDGLETASSLLSAAIAASARRGRRRLLVVCPAAWGSKAALLERRGLTVAKVWLIRR